MAHDPEEVEKRVLTKLMYFNATIVGLVIGVIFGCGIFMATNFLILKGGEVVGPHLALLGEFLIGYKVTFVGSLVGLAYGLVIGFVVGYVGSRLYNLIASIRDRRDGKQEY